MSCFTQADQKNVPFVMRLTLNHDASD